MRRLWIVVFLVVTFTQTAHAQTADPVPGISRDLAEARRTRISDLHYDLCLAIPKLTGALIAGDLKIRFQLNDPSTPLVLDFAPGADHVGLLTTNGVPGYRAANGHLVLPALALRKGENVVAIRFTAGDASLNRSPDFLYALFVPARAHLAIPCFDQPSLKARWKLSVQVPGDAHWQVVGNGALMARVNFATSASQGIAVVGESGATPTLVPGSNAPEVGWVEYRFAETEPLPTYLFSLAVGDFQVETAERDGRTMHLYHRETDAAKVARNKTAIFDLHARALAFMEEYTGIPYAFGKFDLVLIPAFQFGGMEHAGEIFYNSSGLMLDESATQNQFLGRASTIAHETAHMWFGDLVTMQWFDDVWMKEVFANFMAAKIVNPSFPSVNHELRFLLAHYPAAYEVDRTLGANSIRQPLENLNEAGSLYGAIIYQKAPIVMRHLENLMGEVSFRDGLREYLKGHAFGNATWPDLIAVLDRRMATSQASTKGSTYHAGDLKIWSHVWVEEPGRPTVTTEISEKKGRVTKLAFRQSDVWQRKRTWPQQLRVALGYADHVRILSVSIDGGVGEAKAAVGEESPLFVLPNAEGWAYGDFVLDAKSLAYLSTSLPDIADPLLRGSAWVTIWDAMLDRRLAAARFVDLALAALPRETDEQITARTLNYLRSAWWRFLQPEERATRLTRLESVLREGLASASGPSRKSAWFSALRDVAITGPTLAWLQDIWAQKENVPGLPLAEPDYAALAQELAVREVSGSDDILKTQWARMKNPDRKARFGFVLPALSADPDVCERWFQSLRDVENRRHEPWVLDGLGYLNHPLRAAKAIPDLRPALELLPEIQRTGDIFFPTRWMTAALAGHNSREAADIVRAHLAALPPDYPPRLKAIILQTSDELFRATSP